MRLGVRDVIGRAARELEVGPAGIGHREEELDVHQRRGGGGGAQQQRDVGAGVRIGVGRGRGGVEAEAEGAVGAAGVVGQGRAAGEHAARAGATRQARARKERMRGLHPRTPEPRPRWAFRRTAILPEMEAERVEHAVARARVWLYLRRVRPELKDVDPGPLLAFTGSMSDSADCIDASARDLVRARASCSPSASACPSCRAASCSGASTSTSEGETGPTGRSTTSGTSRDGSTRCAGC